MLSQDSSNSKISRNLSQGKQTKANNSHSSKLNRFGKQNIPILSQKPPKMSHKQIGNKANCNRSEQTNNDHLGSSCGISITNNLDDASLQDMVELLKQYEKVCLQKQDFSSAEQAKNKIQFLKAQQVILRKQELENQDKENIERISKQGEEEIKMFQEHWDQQLQQLIEALKQVEGNLTQQHQKQLQEIQEKLSKQQAPKVKYSSQILQIRKYLSNLIRVKNYKEAEVIKIKLQNKEKEEQQKWAEKFEHKKHHKMETIIKKQQNELKALRIRLQGVFNEKLKQRDQKFQILLKKNRKRRIQSGKMSRERLKTKTALMNQSKSYMQSTMGALGNSTYKF